ncbi:MAG: response regulator [Gammaproteobacteria bacterium]
MATKKPQILFVDDEPHILNSMRWLFQRDYDVTLAHGGVDAIEELSSHDFDVIVSDQRMPGLSGIDVLRIAKLKSPRTMRILLTGYADMEATIQSVNEGEVFRYVTKPWVNEELKDVVRLAVEASRESLDIDVPAKVKGREESERPVPEEILVIDDDMATKKAIQQIVGDLAVVHWANDAESALDQLERHPIGVVVSDTIVKGAGVTPLLNLLKRHHPAIVTVIFTAQSDAYLVMDLINKGQVFRFLRKPIRQGQYRLSILAAIKKHHQLLLNPKLGKRHRVGALPLRTKENSSQDGLFDRWLNRIKNLPQRVFASA